MKVSKMITTGLLGPPLLLFTLEASCREKQAVNLEPDDPRRIYSVQVADQMEAALLEQQLELEPIRQDGLTLFYFEAPRLNERLRTLGYEPVRQNPYEIYRRVVRLERRGSEQELLAAGVRIINREKDYWVAEGSIARLRALQGSGYRLSAVTAEEPRPREVRIGVKTREDVRKVGALQVDIYNVRTTDAGFDVFAGAFDYQIDRLREEGFTIELISTVEREERR